MTSTLTRVHAIDLIKKLYEFFLFFTITEFVEKKSLHSFALPQTLRISH